MTRKTWYISTAADSKGNYILQTTEGKLVIKREEIGDLDLSKPASVAKLDKFVNSNTGRSIKDDDSGKLTTFFGFGEGTREYASTESKVSHIKHVMAETAEAVEAEYEEEEV